VSWVGSENLGFLFWNTVIASLVILVLFDPIKAFANRLTSKIFFKSVRTFDDMIKTLRSDITTISTAKELARTILFGLEKGLSISQAALYLIDRSGTKYHLIDSLRKEEILPSDIVASSAFVGHLKKVGVDL